MRAEEKLWNKKKEEVCESKEVCKGNEKIYEETKVVLKKL